MNNNSGVNTVLIVLLLVLVVGGFVWYASTMPAKEEAGGSMNVDVNLPGGSNSGSNN